MSGVYRTAHVASAAVLLNLALQGVDFFFCRIRCHYLFCLGVKNFYLNEATGLITNEAGCLITNEGFRPYLHHNSSYCFSHSALLFMSFFRHEPPL